MSSRKSEKDRLRAERLAAEQRDAAADRKRLLLGYAVAGLLTLAVVVGIVFAISSGGGGSTGGGSGKNVNTSFGGIIPDGVTVDTRDGTAPPPIANGDLTGAANVAGCELQQNLTDEGNTHLKPSDPTPDYKTNPPTSGDHSPDPLADGAFATMPSPLNFLHALEHGRVEIQYSSKLPEADQLALLGVFQAADGGVSIFPNDDMPYEVAATAWTQLMGCKSYKGDATLDAVRDFIAEYRGRGPEPVGF